MKKVVLAYSGGLDTCVSIRWLRDKGYDVLALLADLGQKANFELLKKRAISAGAEKVYVSDLKKEFVQDFILPSLKAEAVYEDYLLTTALGRPLIAKEVVKIAHKERADYVAHGCTGRGNDQVRFELSYKMLDPRLKVIAPLREWEFNSREEEIEYAKKNGISLDLKKSVYSIDENLWGVSIECGELEDPYNEPSANAWQIGALREISKPTYLEIYFDRGIPTDLNNKRIDTQELIVRLNKIGGKYAIGRKDLIEDRIVGIKSRELYEAPAAEILYKAHHALESLILDKQTLNFKHLISLKYGELIYSGLWFSTLREALSRFVDFTQEKVQGTVRIKLSPGNCEIVGRKSRYALYKKELATYGKDSKFDQKAAEGLIKILGMGY
ncbi:MAG: argininosuccinate synthase [Candidatus Omnitrophica bacterium]|nr:argininosuccinate synthase [Candidatus Omnitrophota bacterium]